MYWRSAQTPQQAATLRAKNIKRNANKLAQLAAEKEELRKGITEINAQRAAEEDAENRQKVAELILQGKVAVEQLTLHGWTSDEVLAVQAGKHKDVARKRLAPIAMQRIESAMMSEDEKNAIVASKIVIDMVDEEKEDMSKRPVYVRMQQIEGVAIDVGEDIVQKYDSSADGS